MGRAASWLMTMVVLATTSCALVGGGPGHESGNASLSEAAARASPDTSKLRSDEADARKKRLDVGYVEPPAEVTTSVEATGESSQEDAAAEEKAGASGMVISAVLGGGTLGGASYDGYSFGGLGVGQFLGPRWRIDLVGTASSLNFVGQSVAGQAFENETELALDFTARYYLTPAHTMMGLYPLAGVRFGTLFWDFAEPITIVEDGVSRTIEDDYINYFSMFGGMGVSLVQIRHLHVGANLAAGLRIYSWSTKAGFSNDLLPPTGFLHGTIEMSYKF